MSSTLFTALIYSDDDHLAAMLKICDSVVLDLEFCFALAKSKILAESITTLTNCRL
jgi:hypothetical protein